MRINTLISTFFIVSSLLIIAISTAHAGNLEKSQQAYAVQQKLDASHFHIDLEIDELETSGQ